LGVNTSGCNGYGSKLRIILNFEVNI